MSLVSPELAGEIFTNAQSQKCDGNNYYSVEILEDKDTKYLPEGKKTLENQTLVQRADKCSLLEEGIYVFSKLQFCDSAKKIRVPFGGYTSSSERTKDIPDWVCLYIQGFPTFQNQKLKGTFQAGSEGTLHSIYFQ